MWMGFLQLFGGRLIGNEQASGFAFQIHLDLPLPTTSADWRVNSNPRRRSDRSGWNAPVERDGDIVQFDAGYTCFKLHRLAGLNLKEGVPCFGTDTEKPCALCWTSMPIFPRDLLESVLHLCRANRKIRRDHSAPGRWRLPQTSDGVGDGKGIWGQCNSTRRRTLLVQIGGARGAVVRTSSRFSVSSSQNLPD